MFVPVLDPSKKTEDIKKYWGPEKLKNVLEYAEDRVSCLSDVLLMLAELMRCGSVQATLS